MNALHPNTLHPLADLQSRIEQGPPIRPYLELIRLPNLTTAAADVLAGYAIAGLPSGFRLPWLLAATIALYGGGVALNDVFDAGTDAVERAERPIPSGRIARAAAARLGALLLIAGVGFASFAGPISGRIALLIALSAVAYDAWGKHHTLFGPILMGLCRGLNLLLGISAVPALVLERGALALIPFTYIAAVTLVSRGEVKGGGRPHAAISLTLIGLALIGLIFQAGRPEVRFAVMLPFLLIFSCSVVPAFWRAALDPQARTIRRAVKTGVLSLILLDACFSAGYAGFAYASLVLLLAWLGRGLADRFAVT